MIIKRPSQFRSINSVAILVPKFSHLSILSDLFIDPSVSLGWPVLTLKWTVIGINYSLFIFLTSVFIQGSSVTVTLMSKEKICHVKEDLTIFLSNCTCCFFFKYGLSDHCCLHDTNATREYFCSCIYLLYHLKQTDFAIFEQ